MKYFCYLFLKNFHPYILFLIITLFSTFSFLFTFKFLPFSFGNRANKNCNIFKVFFKINYSVLMLKQQFFSTLSLKKNYQIKWKVHTFKFSYLLLDQLVFLLFFSLMTWLLSSRIWLKITSSVCYQEK